MKKILQLLLLFLFACKQANQSETNPQIASNCKSRGCTGSENCTACKNCSGCKYCAKQGGTCGVCEPKTKKETPKSTSKNSKKKK